jgi:very-short-patch-repair endonuclease
MFHIVVPLCEIGITPKMVCNGRFTCWRCNSEDYDQLVYNRGDDLITCLTHTPREYRMPWGPFGRQPAYQEGPPRAPAPVPSPIEGQFWSAYMRLHPRALRGLVPQHKVGPFRIDFALPRQKFGIELDGLRDHASTEAMARDRARERYLMRQGWIIVRFGGTEVYHNAPACVQEAADLANHDKKVRR